MISGKLKKKSKVRWDIIAFALLVAFALAFFYGWQRYGSTPVARKPLSDDFVGTYSSAYYNINIVIYPDERENFYYDQAGRKPFKGSVKKISEKEYVLKTPSGEEKITFQGKDFVFEKGGLIFHKKWAEYYETPELRFLREDKDDHFKDKP